MDTETEQKVKLTRNELLAKARQAKAEKAKQRELTKNIADLDISEDKNKKKSKAIKPKVEITNFEIKKEEEEPEIVEEIVRVPANRKKKIVKRTIEIEESETDEEVIEEIVKIPKIKKEVKISRDEMKKRLIENNKQRLHNELFC